VVPPALSPKSRAHLGRSIQRGIRAALRVISCEAQLPRSTGIALNLESEVWLYPKYCSPSGKTPHATIFPISFHFLYHFDPSTPSTFNTPNPLHLPQHPIVSPRLDKYHEFRTRSGLPLEKLLGGRRPSAGPELDSACRRPDLRSSHSGHVPLTPGGTYQEGGGAQRGNR